MSLLLLLTLDLEEFFVGLILISPVQFD